MPYRLPRSTTSDRWGAAPTSVYGQPRSSRREEGFDHLSQIEELKRQASHTAARGSAFGLALMSEDDFASVVDANLTAAFRVCKRATQGMLRARSGRIILMSSVVALFGSAGQANYAASKAGLVGVARSLARELGSRSITVNVVAPGPGPSR